MAVTGGNKSFMDTIKKWNKLDCSLCYLCPAVNSKKKWSTQRKNEWDAQNPGVAVCEEKFVWSVED